MVYPYICSIRDIAAVEIFFRVLPVAERQYLVKKCFR